MFSQFDHFHVRLGERVMSMERFQVVRLASLLRQSWQARREQYGHLYAVIPPFFPQY